LAWAGHRTLASQRLAHLRMRCQRALPRPERLQARVHELHGRLERAFASGIQQRQARITALATHLAHLNPAAVLERGYSIVRRTDGSIVRDRRQLEVDEAVELTLARGMAGARITRLSDGSERS
ncbi:MAG: exodeoxyribonuclease VII large subunit, partial [Thiobacillaceae bacterium]